MSEVPSSAATDAQISKYYFKGSHQKKKTVLFGKDKVAEMDVENMADMEVDTILTTFHNFCQISRFFYRTQVSLGSGLWVPIRQNQPLSSLVSIF